MTLVPPSSHGGLGTVTSVAAANASVVVAGTAADPTISTGTLDAIATAEPPAAAVALNAKKITGLAVATAATDAASLANTLDQFGAPAANLALNAKKITGLANGSAATDALAVGQVLASGALPIADLVDPGAGNVIGSSGGVATALKPPGYAFDSAQVTSGTTISATSEGTATTIVTGASITYDGATAIEIRFFSPEVDDNGNAAGNACLFVLYDNGASIGIVGVILSGLTGGLEVPGNLWTRLTPSNAAHQYSIRAYRTNANCTVQGGAGGSGAYRPAQLWIVKV